ncbi:cold shock domain-containing protein [Sphingomonas panacisoli]|uniref:Cold shock domain-containing protein n=2 Tax=Sphingomonas panacisoli TaxID=1813879 RepID=A0A5B8LFV2_9SPHN|nr:cold shock domain-containing protein [Sphingomonas panacisoli]QDZ06749.1 cold shock domain-containing protein [Sphingomonas panacisoli]
MEMTTGTVKFFNADKGYGFIAPDGGGQDAFVHITALEAAGINTLNQNDRVTYDLENDKRGKQAAVNVKMAAE